MVVMLKVNNLNCTVLKLFKTEAFIRRLQCASIACIFKVIKLNLHKHFMYCTPCTVQCDTDMESNHIPYLNAIFLLEDISYTTNITRHFIYYKYTKVMVYNYSLTA